MTYTAVNPHACCNRPRPEDAHATVCPPPHPHASPHLTNRDRLCWKTDGRQPANGPHTATPQHRRHSPSTPARGPPRPPTPRPSPQPPPPPSQSQGQVPAVYPSAIVQLASRWTSYLPGSAPDCQLSDAALLAYYRLRLPSPLASLGSCELIPFSPSHSSAHH
jgi:hypothetical protein